MHVKFESDRTATVGGITFTNTNLKSCAKALVCAESTPKLNVAVEASKVYTHVKFQSDRRKI